MKINVGDLVIKDGDLDIGQIALVLEVKENDVGNSFVKVLNQEGEIKTWYMKLVRLFESAMHVT
tara:strand:- start:52 stop:243 length:192 start_codon:yes stop_codon:yes gene_type:complete